jgi:hypothetical protein
MQYDIFDVRRWLPKEGDEVTLDPSDIGTEYGKIEKSIEGLNGDGDIIGDVKQRFQKQIAEPIKFKVPSNQNPRARQFNTASAGNHVNQKAGQQRTGLPLLLGAGAATGTGVAAYSFFNSVGGKIVAGVAIAVVSAYILRKTK